MDAASAVAIATPFTAAQESFSAKPYWDVNGYAIGYGNHYYSDGSAVSADDDNISLADAQYLLGFTLNQVASTIIPMVTAPITNNMLAALLDLGYNWGAGNVGNSVLLQKINQGASDQDIQAQWNKTAITAGGILNSVLVARRADESSLAFSGASSDSLGLVVLLLAGVFIAGFVLTAGKKRKF